jgi:hypothetical protein
LILSLSLILQARGITCQNRKFLHPRRLLLRRPVVRGKEGTCLRRLHRRILLVAVRNSAISRVFMSESTGFSVLRVEPTYSYSRVLGMGRQPRAPIASGYAAVHVRCNSCGHTWRAPKSRSGAAGYFYPLLGHMQLICPQCKQDEIIENPPLP